MSNVAFRKVAISKDGLHFTARQPMLGHAYMRVFEYNGAFGELRIKEK